MNTASLPKLDLSTDDEKVLELLELEPPSRARHCFRSAVYHLHRALLLQDIDPAMSIFRGLTAEEEAASGLMHCFIEKNYPNADKLNPWNHVQKHAVTPFLRFLLHHLAEIKLTGVQSVRMALKDIDGTRRLVVAFQLEGDIEPQSVVPIPPLNLTISEGAGRAFPDLARNIRQLLEPTGYTNARSFLMAEANFRNQLLYAGPTGFPVIEDLKPEYLRERQRRVLTIAKAALLILPYEEVQPFASDALTSFLRLVGKLINTAIKHSIQLRRWHRPHAHA
jgi:hypothetical protein